MCQRRHRRRAASPETPVDALERLEVGGGGAPLNSVIDPVLGANGNNNNDNNKNAASPFLIDLAEEDEMREAELLQPTRLAATAVLDSDANQEEEEEDEESREEIPLH